MASGKQKGPPPQPSKGAALLARLKAALANTELDEVLVASLSMHDREARVRLLEQLNPTTAAALRRALTPPRRPHAVAAVVPSQEKLRQQWDSLWAEWNGCVEESGLLDGRYVRQERRWKAPYFDPTSLSLDLDGIARRLRSLLAPVRKAGIAGDFSFLDQIRRLDDELASGLPEWMDPGELELMLGPEATLCMLEWEGGVPERPRRELFDLVDAVVRLAAELERVFFDEKTVARYVAAWPDPALRAVLGGITRARGEPHWSRALERSTSPWFHMLRTLARRFDPAQHADLSAAHIAEDFTLAAPLVSGAMKRRDHVRAAALLAEAFRALLRGPAGSEWDPSSELLALRVHLDHDRARKHVAVRFVHAWRKIAEAAGESDIAAALGLQALALKDPEDGEALVAAFRELDRAGLPRVRQALLKEWANLVAERTLRGRARSGDDALGTWVRVLVGAAVVGPGAKSAVRSAVRRVLPATAKALKQPRGGGSWRDPYGWEDRRELFALARLSLDLDANGSIEKRMPSFHRELRGVIGERATRLDRVRQRWFAELGGAELLDDVLAFWRTHLDDIIPDPDRANYALCVRWLLAGMELDRASGARILLGWARTHRLKRTLWKAVREAGLHVPTGVKSD